MNSEYSQVSERSVAVDVKEQERCKEADRHTVTVQKDKGRKRFCTLSLLTTLY